MTSGHILQIFLRVTIQSQIRVAQRIIVDEVIQFRPLRHGHVQCILDPDAGYTEDKGDFEIPTEDEPEDTGEEDTEPI